MLWGKGPKFGHMQTVNSRDQPAKLDSLIKALLIHEYISTCNSKSELRRTRSACAYAQADLSVPCSHMIQTFSPWHGQHEPQCEKTSDMWTRRNPKSVCASTQSDQSLRCTMKKMRPENIPIRLRICAGWLHVVLAERFCPKVRFLTFRIPGESTGLFKGVCVCVCVCVCYSLREKNIGSHHECPCRIEKSHPRGRNLNNGRGLPSPWLKFLPRGWDFPILHGLAHDGLIFLPPLRGLFLGPAGLLYGHVIYHGQIAYLI